MTYEVRDRCSIVSELDRRPGTCPTILSDVNSTRVAPSSVHCDSASALWAHGFFGLFFLYAMVDLDLRLVLETQSDCVPESRSEQRLR